MSTEPRTPEETRDLFRWELWSTLQKLVPPAEPAELERFLAELGADARLAGSPEECFDALLVVAKERLSQRAAREWAALEGALRARPEPRSAPEELARELLFWVSCELPTEALLEALEPFAPRSFDANERGAWEVRALWHPDFGLGIPWLEPADAEHRSYRARVLFRDGERTLEGPAARWEDPRERFFAEASIALVARVPDAELEPFWALVAELGWGAPGSTIDSCAERLRARASYEECLRLAGRLRALSRELGERLEAWEKSEGERLECGDDAFGDLCAHLVGLGRAEYEATMADPHRALDRAWRGDYEESFAYVFQRAEQRYGVDEVERALRAFGEPIPWAQVRERPAYGAVVEHPARGLGVVILGPREEQSVLVAFAGRTVRLAFGG